MYQKVWLEPTFEGDTDFLEFTKKGNIGFDIFYGIHKNVIDQEKVIGKGDENNKVPGPRLRYTALNAILGSRNIPT